MQEQVVSSLMDKFSNQLKQQTQNWYGCFNSAGTMTTRGFGGDLDFAANFMNYVRMSFVSVALNSNKSVLEKSLYNLCEKTEYNLFLENLAKLRGKLLFSSENVQIYSFSHSVVFFDCSKNYSDGCILSFNIDFFKDLLDKK